LHPAPATAPAAAPAAMRAAAAAMIAAAVESAAASADSGGGGEGEAANVRGEGEGEGEDAPSSARDELTDEEMIEEITPEAAASDPLRDATIRRSLGDKTFAGRVEAVEWATQTHRRLYRIRYEDGDLEHFTADEVIACIVPVVPSSALAAPSEPTLAEPIAAMRYATRIFSSHAEERSCQEQQVRATIQAAQGSVEHHKQQAVATGRHLKDASIPDDLVAAATAVPENRSDQNVRNAARERVVEQAKTVLAAAQALFALHGQPKHALHDLGSALLQQLGELEVLHRQLAASFMELREVSEKSLRDHEATMRQDVDKMQEQQGAAASTAMSAAAAAISAIVEQKRGEAQLQKALIDQDLQQLRGRQLEFLKANDDPDQNETFRGVLDSIAHKEQRLGDIDAASDVSALEQLLTDIKEVEVSQHPTVDFQDGAAQQGQPPAKRRRFSLWPF